MKKFREYLFRIVRLAVVYILPGGKIRDLLMWPITSRLLGVNYSKVIKLKSNLSMHVYLGDQLGRMMLFYGNSYEYFWEPTTVRIVEKLVSKANRVLLAGSHIGLLALYARKAMKAACGGGHTFEPEENLYKMSQCNFDLNVNLGKIILNKEGLSNSHNENAYIVSDTLRSRVVFEPVANAAKVSLTTIDSYIEKNNLGSFDFILLDVEGLELEVFQGANNMLENNPPSDIIFEISPRILGGLTKSDKILDLLKRKKYKFYIINDDYSFKRFDNQNREKEIFNYDDYLSKFKDKEYFNVYATQRSEPEILKIGINL